MLPSWFLHFPPDVRLTAGADGQVFLSRPGLGRLALRDLGPGTVTALGRLSPPGESADRLARLVGEAAGPTALARWFYYVQHLARCGLLHFSIRSGDASLGTLVPIAPSFTFAPAVHHPDSRCVLSRFASLRRLDDSLVLESPLSFGRVLLHDSRAVALLHDLARPCRQADLAGRSPVAEGLLALLLTAGMVQEVNAEGTTAEDRHSGLRIWEFHDLLFHARSREGRHADPVGATFPWAGEMEPPPALKPAAAGGIDLYRPDLDELQRRDPPLARVQEERRSIRDYGDEPISAGQLGEFLYRVGRLRDCQERDVQTPAGTVRMEFASRPYPAGGGLYELEVYPVIGSCRDLPPGLYHYAPARHRLEPITGRTAEVDELLRSAGMAAGVAFEDVQVLLILAARFARVAWKYSSLAYALVLKHVGVLYMNMYLNATAMGLAPCAVGTGDSDRFARAAGTDYYTETSVGEFLLGSRR